MCSKFILRGAWSTNESLQWKHSICYSHLGPAWGCLFWGVKKYIRRNTEHCLSLTVSQSVSSVFFVHRWHQDCSAPQRQRRWVFCLAPLCSPAVVVAMAAAEPCLFSLLLFLSLFLPPVVFSLLTFCSPHPTPRIAFWSLWRIEETGIWLQWLIHFTQQLIEMANCTSPECSNQS